MSFYFSYSIQAIPPNTKPLALSYSPYEKLFAMQKLSLVALFQTLCAFQNPNAFTLKHKYWWKFVSQSFIFNNQKFLVLIALMSYRLFHIFIAILYTLILNINLKTFPSDYYKRKKVGRKKFLFVKLFINTKTKKHH